MVMRIIYVQFKNTIANMLHCKMLSNECCRKISFRLVRINEYLMKIVIKYFQLKMIWKQLFNLFSQIMKYIFDIFHNSNLKCVRLRSFANKNLEICINKTYLFKDIHKFRFKLVLFHFTKTKHRKKDKDDKFLGLIILNIYYIF